MGKTARVALASHLIHENLPDAPMFAEYVRLGHSAQAVEIELDNVTLLYGFVNHSLDSVPTQG